jgi:hypothetical protein
MSEQNNAQKKQAAYQESFEATQRGEPVPVLEPLPTKDLSPETKEIVQEYNKIIESSNKGIQAANS